MAHRRGESRYQAALFPVMLDELVKPDSLVRVVDAWVGSLDLHTLGFAKAQAQARGAPPYDPADLLKLYLWGYLNAVRSTRALECECHRDVECMWLLGRLAPDHKTIAEFRRTNTAALVAACAGFVEFARCKRLIGGNTVAIDGTKIRAVASRKAVRHEKELIEQAQRNAAEIQSYLQRLDAQDKQEDKEVVRGEEVRRALRELQDQQQEIQAHVQRLQQSRATTAVLGEPDAQVMGDGSSRAPAYNVQTAVESESHLIVAHAVTGEANDQRQLQPMVKAASAALTGPVIGVADAGYNNAEQMAALDEEGLTTFVAENRSVNNQGDGTLYDRSVFTYDRERDCFTCPAGHLLERSGQNRKNKQVIYAAKKKDCSNCPQKQNCTEAARRRVTRHVYEEAREANAQRLREHPEMMRLRQQTVEHPFADLKHRILGTARLLMRGIEGAKAEMSLAVLAYNVKRAFNMKGAHWMLQAIQG